MTDSSIIGQLYQRKMFRIGAGYLAVAWVLWQVVASTCPTLECSIGFSRTILWLLLGGFPVTLAVAWVNWKTAIIVGVAFIAGAGVAVMMMGSQPIPVELTPLPVAEEVERERLPNSVAVLPFENLSLNSEDAFFAAGIHDTILKELAKIRDMNVISRTAMLRYIDNPTPIPQVAEELNVQTVMEGSVQYAGERVLVTVQLIDPETDTHIWAESYNESFSDIFAIQADIAIKIAMALEAELSLAEQQNIEREPTNSPEAYEYFLRARVLVPNVGSINVPTEFHEYLDRAIELDPDFAMARALKAADYAFALRRPGFSVYEPLTLIQREALALGHAQKALSIDPNLGLGHFAMGLIHRANWRGEEAINAFERAYDLNPNDTDILDDYSRTLSFSGRHTDAIRVAERAFELSSNLIPLRIAHLAAGNYDEAVEVTRKILDERLTVNDHYNYALALHLSGRASDAREQLEIANSVAESEPPSSYGAYINGLLGDAENASRIFSQWEREAGVSSYSPSEWAFAYLALRDEPRALEWLSRAANNRQPYTADFRQFDFAQNIYRDPILDKPEFVEVRKRLGFQD